MIDSLEYIIAGNTLKQYIISIMIFISIYLFLIIFKSFLLKKAKIISEKTENKRDDLIVKKISSISVLFYIIICVYVPLKYLSINQTLDNILNIMFIMIIFWELSNIIISTIKYLLDNNLYQIKNGKRDVTKINLLYLISKIIVYIIGGLIFLSNIGVEITPLIASLGVAGIAVAFALQKILGDIFSSFSIYLDKPFEIGDFLVIGDDNGIVKDIGLKSTRIQTLHGQELIIPNTEVTSSRINNYGKMKRRRVVFSIGVIYQTKLEKIEKIPFFIKKIVESTENTEFDRTHFIEFGKSELNFEIVYYIKTGDYLIYRDVHQNICLEIMKKFKKEGISFAYPTQSIYIENQK